MTAPGRAAPVLERATFRTSRLHFQEASRLSGLSPDSLRRHHGDRIVKLSPRRSGMRVIDALMIQQAVNTGVA